MELLRENGHHVDLFSYDNADTVSLSRAGKLQAGARAVYSRRTEDDLHRFLNGKSFDVAHVHNTWFTMTPSVYKALWQAGLPVVKTVHNYRWLCPIGTLYRNGNLCHDCITKPGGVLHGVVHRCYQGLLLPSMAASARLYVHRDLMKVYHRYIDVIVTQNDFVRSLLVRHGFPGEKMVIRGNFAPRVSGLPARRGEAAVFAGRLEAAKGLTTLLDAIGRVSIPLQIFGQGPLERWVRDQVVERYGRESRVRFEGYVSRTVLLRSLASARAVVFPSEWYESFPLSIVEAMALGKPVIASNIGSMPTIIQNEVNGLLFEAGNAHSLAQAMRRLWDDDQLQRRLEIGAGATYEASMTPEIGYRTLIEIYESAIRLRKRQASGSGE
jgi:glycosyltransferase involved in cell wall biosynthesis